MQHVLSPALLVTTDLNHTACPYQHLGLHATTITCAMSHCCHPHLVSSTRCGTTVPHCPCHHCHPHLVSLHSQTRCVTTVTPTLCSHCQRHLMSPTPPTPPSGVFKVTPTIGHHRHLQACVTSVTPTLSRCRFNSPHSRDFVVNNHLWSLPPPSPMSSRHVIPRNHMPSHVITRH